MGTKLIFYTIVIKKIKYNKFSIMNAKILIQKVKKSLNQLLLRQRHSPWSS